MYENVGEFICGYYTTFNWISAPAPQPYYYHAKVRWVGKHSKRKTDQNEVTDELDLCIFIHRNRNWQSLCIETNECWPTIIYKDLQINITYISSLVVVFFFGTHYH